MSPPSWMKVVGPACAAFALSGCVAGARMTATQPDQPPPFDQLALRGKWAFFDTRPEADRILLAFAHPGAVDGRRQYFLYLQTPPQKETHVFGAAPEPHADSNNSVRGFFLQSEGAMAGLTALVSGRVQVGGSPFDGGKLRIGRFELRCADGTQLIGRFTARQNFLEMRTFEEDLYPADVRALAETTGPEAPATRSGGPQ